MESMDTSQPRIGRGRGRGNRWPNNKPGIGSPPKAVATEPNSGQNSSQSGRPEVTTPSSSSAKDERLRRLEERAGISMDFFEEAFKIGGDMTRFQKLNPVPNFDWFTPKPEPKKEEPDKEVEKKFQGKQYVAEAKEREEQRIKEKQIQEKESQSSRNQSPICGPGRGQTPSRGHNLSTLSLQTSNIESVGTYQPIEPMDAIVEDEANPENIGKYFLTIPLRPKLPIVEYEDRILKALSACRVVIIEGATGCGKTTQVPQFIADDCASKGIPFNIVVTQPRRIAAKSIAARVAEERDWQLGTVVGYQIGMDRQNVSADTRLLYCTTGVLLQKLINQKNLDNYSHIIVDEVHERSIDTDLLLLVIKKLMIGKSQSVKIILMSATFDVTEFKNYFAINLYDESGDVTNISRPTHIKINERPQSLSIYYIKEVKRFLGIHDMPKDVRTNQRTDPTEKDAACVSYEAMEVAVQILERGLILVEGEDMNRGSVLIFLPGLEEIHELKARLDKSPEKLNQHWVIYPLHSSIPLEKQNLVFQRQRGRERKIILATNIAESSITVPDVSYVIDFCLTKSLVMDIETHIPVLRLEWASRGNCDQRAGRAGRCSEGRVYRLITQAFFKSTLQEHSLPELNRSPLDLSILRVKLLNMGPPKELLGLALSPPDLADIYQSVLQLKQVGAFAIKVTDHKRVYYEDEDGDLTVLGRIISCLPIDIRLGKLICMGHLFDVLEDCIIIAACLSTQGMFRRDFGQGLDSYKSRLAWADRSFSDSIAHLNAYKTFKRFGAEFDVDQRMAENWCKQNYIQYKRVKEVDYMIGELMSRLSSVDIHLPDRPNLKRNRNEEELILKVVMCAAFYPNYFTRNEIDTSRIARDLCNKDPLDTVAIAGFPLNQGILYTQEIRRLFSICSNRIDISYEDSKAYLTFLDDKHPLREAFDLHIPEKIKREMISGSHSSLSTLKSEGTSTPMSQTSMNTSSSSNAYERLMKRGLKETTIKTAVYVAVAMRSHREVNKELPKVHPKVAEKQLKSLQKFKTEEQLNQQTFHSNRIYVPHVMTRQKLTRLPLPALDCSEIDIRVTFIVSPSAFYAQYAHPMTTEALNELSSIISYDLEMIPCVPEHLRIGDIVIGEFSDQKGAKMHGRARIDNIECKFGTKEVDLIQVFFIDYGITKLVDKIQELSLLAGPIPQRIYEIPPQAFRCSLSEVNPSPISSFDSCWSKKSIEYFKKWVQQRDTMTAKIYSVISRVVRLELFDNIYRVESFNDKLVNIGMAEKWEESPVSKLNHDQRRREYLNRPVETVDDSVDNKLSLETYEKGVYNPDDVIEIDYKPSTDKSGPQTHDKILIKGPSSPLECNFTGVSRTTNARSVSIEKSSVNCVVLEPDYLSKHTRLIVASSMGLGQNSGNINLRDTTLMPNIRGFPALMALLFAPRVQLRANKERTHYIGAICGLGYNKENGNAYDPANDAEILFDSDISLNDMIKINIIRYNISSVLLSTETLREYSGGSLAIKQRRIRRNVYELLDRRRRLQDNSRCFANFRWNDITADDLNRELKTTEFDLNHQILPICEMQKLNEFDYYLDIEQNLKQLRLLADGGVSMTTSCKLCGFTAYTRTDVDNHLHNDRHLDAVKDFNKEYKISLAEKKKEEYYSQRLEDGIDDEEVELFDVDSDDDEISIVSTKN